MLISNYVRCALGFAVFASMVIMDTFALVVGWPRAVCARRRAKGFGQSKLDRKFCCVHGVRSFILRVRGPGK